MVCRDNGYPNGLRNSGVDPAPPEATANGQRTNGIKITLRVGVAVAGFKPCRFPLSILHLVKSASSRVITYPRSTPCMSQNSVMPLRSAKPVWPRRTILHLKGSSHWAMRSSLNEP